MLLRIWREVRCSSQRVQVDYRLFPCVWLMYFMNYLDRTNIGNAKVAGLMDDLNMTDNQYSIALLIFFVGYLLGEVPSNMILSRLRPSIYLPSIVLLWVRKCALVNLAQLYSSRSPGLRRNNHVLCAKFWRLGRPACYSRVDRVSATGVAFELRALADTGDRSGFFRKQSPCTREA